MNTHRLLQGILLSLALSSILITAAAALPAFPGAEGFGADTPGGRGGTVYVVTNLNADGPGSLRKAIEATGPRIVVFEVSGIIELPRTLNINNPYLTIAGQTAPGEGVTVKGEVAIKTHDVVIRYMRFRPGPWDVSDALRVKGDAYNVVIDHCSMSWAVDEVFSTYDNPHDVTVQWSIMSEGLARSIHEKGIHSMGALLGSDDADHLSFHHNLLAHNNQRNPRLKISGTSDIVNNVIYNYGEAAGAATDDMGKQSINYVGNYVKKGPNSRDVAELELSHVQGEKEYGFRIYVSGNIGPHRQSDSQDQRLVVDRDFWGSLVSTRASAPQVTTTSAAVAYEQVLAGAGAILPRRDSVDTRVVSEVRTGTGGIINHPNDRGGWPAMASGTPLPDSDRDGMPDGWEKERGLNPADPADARSDRNGDGYTNIEEYLNSGIVRVGAVTIPSEGGAFPGERVRFTAAYQGMPTLAVIREMRFLVSTNMKEETPQFYGMVTRNQNGAFTASLQPAPGKAFTGSVPLGVGAPKRDGTSIQNGYVRFNTGESWVTVDPATNTVTVTWDVTFLDAYGKRPGQSVFTYVAGTTGEKDWGQYDPVDNYGWHRKGSWAVWDPASPLRYGFFQEAYLESDGYHTQGRTCPLAATGQVDTARCEPWARGDLTHVIDGTARQFHGYDAFVYVDTKGKGWVSQSLIQNDRTTSWVRDCPINRNTGVDWKACSWRSVDLSLAGLGRWKAYAAYALTQGTTRTLTQSMISGDFVTSRYRSCPNSSTGAPDWNRCTAWSSPSNVPSMKGLEGRKYPGYTSYSIWNGGKVSLVQRLIADDGLTEKARTCAVTGGRPDWTGCDGKWTTTSLSGQAWAKDAQGKAPAEFTELGIIYYYPKGETVPVAFEPRV